MTMDYANVQPRYSGPHRSGICTCGHSWNRHHLGMVARQEYIDATGEHYIAQECEFYGFNEMGGLGPDGEPHCWSYRDSLAPEDFK